MLQNYTGKLFIKEQLTKTVFRFVINLPKNTPLLFTPGQYLLLETNGLYRQYSLSNCSCQQQHPEILVDLKPTGPGSLYLQNLKVGDTVSFRAPLGLFTLKKTPQPKYFLATGVGIAPIKAMILDLYKKSFAAPFQLFWGLANRNELYLKELWLKIHQQNAHFQYTYCISQQTLVENHCFCGHIQEAILAQKLLPQSEFYLCGRPDTVKALKEFLINNSKINPKLIFHENFT